MAAALDEFEKKYPITKGKAYLTSGNRTIEEQLQIILDPKYEKNYPNIKGRFKSKYKLKTLPKRGELTKEQVEWWNSEIAKQAGKPNGFAHVGGYAQDISVKNLTDEEKQKLTLMLNSKGFRVYNEHYSKSKVTFGVPIGQANLFHLTRK
ncbi:hypothetical protein [uncultured Rhodospira sp.]|uniref:hypothetical protein n=1 Tax=uncultured Rhodospira sp. TaxID=1936189 RepID=UPI00262DB30E|nr:hypothetical protein [uncultured Rhodospira sp.]